MRLDLEALRRRLQETPSAPVRGRVLAVTGLALRFALPGARVGDVVVVQRRGEPLPCEVVGFSEGVAIGMPLGSLVGVGPDDEVRPTGAPFRVPVGEGLLGRVVDGLGRFLDGGPELDPGCATVAADRAPPRALERPPIDRVFPTGVRVIDGLLTLGEGQRVGLFAGSGVGKTTLLGAIARGADADVVVCALVGERGREVRDLLEQLGEAGRAKAIVVAATSDVPALERVRSAEIATAYAEWLRDRGMRVLLVVDSITRYARALREIGLSVGEPPTRRGFPPSVFAALPRLLERAGRAGGGGSITAIYTVLVEGGDLDEPVADEVRGILDGHIVLDRGLAERGRFPAVNAPASVSRLMGAVATKEHQRLAARLRALLVAYEGKRDLVQLGAYAKGADKTLDETLAKLARIERLLSQGPGDPATFASTVGALEDLVG
ncbi:MAG: FliI/YscN family ATPase [Myxococcales bacterium]|nr:FliI/YscN family ATPase [Myxococcales bacterium]